MLTGCWQKVDDGRTIGGHERITPRAPTTHVDEDGVEGRQSCCLAEQSGMPVAARRGGDLIAQAAPGPLIVTLRG